MAEDREIAALRSQVSELKGLVDRLWDLLEKTLLSRERLTEIVTKSVNDGINDSNSIQKILSRIEKA